MKGPGIWKMKCSLLEDESYAKDIAAKIPEWIAGAEKDLTNNRIICLRMVEIQHMSMKNLAKIIEPLNVWNF